MVWQARIGPAAVFIQTQTLVNTHYSDTNTGEHTYSHTLEFGLAAKDRPSCSMTEGDLGFVDFVLGFVEDRPSCSLTEGDALCGGFLFSSIRT